jgi:sulfur transfer complex TusBCD TusB component (DsrH family)
MITYVNTKTLIKTECSKFHCCSCYNAGLCIAVDKTELDQRYMSDCSPKTREAMYIKHNLEARWCNRCCSGRAISITYSECVFVALGIQQEMRMRHICGWLYNIFPRYLIRHDFRGEKLLNVKCVF